jgi:hypothetical protein
MKAFNSMNVNRKERTRYAKSMQDWLGVKPKASAARKTRSNGNLRKRSSQK